MRVVYISEEIDARTDHLMPEVGVPFTEFNAARTTAYNAIYDELNAPTELSGFKKLAYDAKTDRYVATWEDREKTWTLRVTDEVADFLTANVGTGGYHRLRVEKGIVTDLNIITMKRKS